ncbi:MAG: ImmA/IrrE family metallo-endopeptidase [Candidatus Dormibacteraceae bacterium]
MSKAEQIAEGERIKLGLGDRGPIADLLRTLEERAGLYVSLVQLGSDGLAGVYQLREELPMVLLNSSHHPVRQRFTLAHEYGHHCLGVETAVDRQIDLHVRDDSEIAANNFAAEILLPRIGVDWWLQRHNDPELDLETLVRLAACYGVSCQVALYRLSACQRIKPNAQRTLQKQIEAGEHTSLARRLRLLQLVDTLVRERGREVRMPAAVARIVLRAYDHGLIDQQAAADRLHVDNQEIIRLSDGDSFV